jgi:uncharacterized membrane protein
MKLSDRNSTTIAIAFVAITGALVDNRWHNKHLTDFGVTIRLLFISPIILVIALKAWAFFCTKFPPIKHSTPSMRQTPENSRSLITSGPVFLNMDRQRSPDQNK